jgi:tRNA pseudouridine38-40 synthase
MHQIRLKLEYDGTDFVGWQFQKNGRSVQEEIEKALKQIYQTDVRITGAGRTDAGVHARGQVACFLIDKVIEIDSVAHSLNSLMPHDVVILKADEVALDFNARYSAKKRRYKYYINQVPSALQRKYCWQVFQRLDILLMQKCADQILGEHQFRAFCKVEEDMHQHNCSVNIATWTQNNNMLEFEILANRFLHGMVRTLVGTMVNVGRGHTDYNEFTKILESKDRSLAGMSAPAKGLFLEEIIY